LELKVSSKTEDALLRAASRIVEDTLAAKEPISETRLAALLVVHESVSEATAARVAAQWFRRLTSPAQQRLKRTTSGEQKRVTAGVIPDAAELEVRKKRSNG
jgi:hypothetical protein